MDVSSLAATFVAVFQEARHVWIKGARPPYDGSVLGLDSPDVQPEAVRSMLLRDAGRPVN